MIAIGIVALALVGPVDVLEQRELLVDGPVREVVTARATYRPRANETLRLPDSVQGSERPTVFLPGRYAMLDVDRGERGTWIVRVPAHDEQSSLRLIARVVRRVTAPVLFQLHWPTITRGETPTRRVLMFPRAILRDAARDWTCPDDGYDVAQCVASSRAPPPLVLRLGSRPSRRWEWAMFVVAMCVSAFAAARAAKSASRSAWLGLVIGWLAGAATALAIAGAHLLSFALAALVSVPVGGAAGAAAGTTRSAATVGALTLLAVMGTLASGLSAMTVCVVAGVGSAGVLGLALRRLPPPRASAPK